MINNDLNIPDELDDLKSIWQKQPEEKSYDKEQIFKMIHRKSVNSIQWLFVITIVELLFAIGVSIWVMISGSNFMSAQLTEIMGEDSLHSYDYVSHMSLIGSIIFVSITFYYYKKISVQSSVKDLMQNIIKFRKTLFWFIISWVGLSIVLALPMYFELGEQIFLQQYNKGEFKVEDINSTAKLTGILIAVISTVLIVLFSLLYYGIIYGIFLRRLGKNLKELKKIES